MEYKSIEHIERSLLREIEEIFKNLAIAIMGIPFVRMYISSGLPLPISDTPSLLMVQKEAELMIEKYMKTLNFSIEKGIDSAWLLSESTYQKNLRRLLPDSIYNFLQRKGLFKPNTQKMIAFKNRKVRGLKLSDRVWKLKDGIFNNVELTLQLGIYEGKSAQEISRDLRNFLREPERLFRRVRNTNGELKLSRAAQNYNPGKGIYRSSYKNALRLAANETNKAYRLADYEKNQENDFIVGIKISLSNNHTINGVPFTDICDDLQGMYPKDFKWSGWHVKCRCKTQTILKTYEEMEKESQFGATISKVSVNSVTSYPKNMEVWTEKNKKRYKPNTVDWIDENKFVKDLIKK